MGVLERDVVVSFDSSKQNLSQGNKNNMFK